MYAAMERLAVVSSTLRCLTPRTPDDILEPESLEFLAGWRDDRQWLKGGVESEQTPKENMIILRNVRVRGKYTRDEHTSFPSRIQFSDCGDSRSNH